MGMLIDECLSRLALQPSWTGQRGRVCTWDCGVSEGGLLASVDFPGALADSSHHAPQ